MAIGLHAVLAEAFRGLASILAKTGVVASGGLGAGANLAAAIRGAVGH